jgi:hypothetical protein
MASVGAESQMGLIKNLPAGLDSPYSLYHATVLWAGRGFVGGGGGGFGTHTQR